MPTPLSTLLLCCLLAGSQAFAQSSQGDALPGKAVERLGPVNAAAPAGNNNSAAANDKDKNIDGGCSRSDWLANKCSHYPGTPPRHRRPIIIVPPPAAPPPDDTPVSADWEGCRKTKLNQLNLTQSGNLERAKQLDEWLWKNCRSYSEDLRQLEQDQM